MIFARQVRNEQTHARQMHLAGANHVDDSRQGPSSSRDIDSAVRNVLGEAELADAEPEHRRTCPVGVQLPFVDLSEVDEQIGFVITRSRNDLACAREQVCAAQSTHNTPHIDHALVVASGSLAAYRSGDRYRALLAPATLRSRTEVCAMLSAAPAHDMCGGVPSRCRR